MSANDLDRRLRNWGRWLRSSVKQGRALSAEGEFRTWDGMVDETPRRQELGAPEYSDAMDIEIAVRLLPLKQHLLLKLRYVIRWSDEAILRNWRRLAGGRLNLRLLEEMEASAQVNLRAVLEQPQVIRNERVLRLVRRMLQKALDTDTTASVPSARQVAPTRPV